MYQPPHFSVEDREALHAFIRAHPLGPAGDRARGSRKRRRRAVSAGRSNRASRPPSRPCRASQSALARCGRARGAGRLPGARTITCRRAGIHRRPNTARSCRRGIMRWSRCAERSACGKSKDWVRGQVGELTQTHEREFERPWAVEDAPRPYMEAQMSAIVGIEIEVVRDERQVQAFAEPAEAGPARRGGGACRTGRAEPKRSS